MIVPSSKYLGNGKRPPWVRMTIMMLKPTGSTCYDASGVEYPQVIPIDFEEELVARCGLAISWRLLFGLPNVPPVITWWQGEVHEYQMEWDGLHHLYPLEMNRWAIARPEWSNLGLLARTYQGSGSEDWLTDMWQPLDKYLQMTGITEALSNE